MNTPSSTILVELLPDGTTLDGKWKLVPTVATIEMEHAAVARVKPYHDEDWYRVMPKDLFRLAWKALLSASPPPPPAATGGEWKTEGEERT